jgi:hypothetical protein
MSIKIMDGLMAACLVAHFPPGWGAGQEREKPKPHDSRTVTKWVSEVQKPGLDNNDWEELGRFDTYDEAVARSTKWSKEHPDSLRLCREREITVRLALPDPGSKAPRTESSGPRGGVITNPGLKTVDPGAMKLGGSKVAPVAGKTGTGTIGTSKVSIKFTGKDGKGKFVVSGELEGEGEWQQDGTGLVMETALSKFRGVLRGDKLVGVRFTKKPGEDGKNALTEWSLTLADTPKQTSVVGKWVYKKSDGGSTILELAAGNTGTYTSTTPGFGSLSMTLTWKLDGEELELTRTGGDTIFGKAGYRFKAGKVYFNKMPFEKQGE